MGNHNPTHQFKNGNTFGGRPKMSAATTKILKLGAEKAIKTISDLAEASGSEKIRLAASVWLAERQYGKAVQPIGNENIDTPFKIKVL